MFSCLITRRQAILGGAALLVGTAPGTAAASQYVLDPDQSKVEFRFRLNGIWHRGRMPIATSSLIIDPNRLAETQVSVSLNARAAKTGFIFATQAMTGSTVLNTAQFPTIRFLSQHIELGPQGRLSGGARVVGDLTLRDVTRSISLQAALHRLPGSTATDLNRLSFSLTGSLSRRAFGASGFSALVHDQIRLNIHASLLKAP